MYLSSIGTTKLDFSCAVIFAVILKIKNHVSDANHGNLLDKLSLDLSLVLIFLSLKDLYSFVRTTL